MPRVVRFNKPFRVLTQFRPSGDKATLADYWFERYPEEYARTLGAFVDEYVVIAHARRDGLRVPRDTVEIDATYYGVPRAQTVAGWNEKTPEGFIDLSVRPAPILRPSICNGSSSL